MHPVEALLVPLGRAMRRRRSDEAASIAHAPELATANHIALTSSSFADGEVIPAKYCGVFIGENVSPALAWSEVPAGTAELLLVIEDLDSPGAAPRIHTIAAIAPRTGGLAEGELVAGTPGVRFLPRRGKPGAYVGPRPMPGHGPHRYRFHLYALDGAIDLDAVADAEHLPQAVDGHVLASGTLAGTRTS